MNRGWKLFDRYCSGKRTRNMAAALSALYDARDILCIPEVDKAVGCPYYRSFRTMAAAVREGFARRTIIPKPYNGKTYRTTFMITEKGGLWVEGWRKYEKALASGAEISPWCRRGAPVGSGMTPIPELVVRKDRKLRERVKKYKEAAELRVRRRKEALKKGGSL